MNVDQHIKVAQWHLEQARLHNEGGHSCGCPVNDHYQKIITEMEAVLAGEAQVQEELACDLNK